MNGSKFIKIGNLFLDLTKITHAQIDDIRISITLESVIHMDFYDALHARDLNGTKLNGVSFRSLRDHLLQHFDAEDILTPVDKAFGTEFILDDAGEIKVDILRKIRDGLKEMEARGVK